jgi:hypothetical protein
MGVSATGAALAVLILLGGLDERVEILKPHVRNPYLDQPSNLYRPLAGFGCA